VHFRHVLAKI